MAPYHDPEDEPIAAEKFDWSFNDAEIPVDDWKIMMYIPFSFFTVSKISEKKKLTRTTRRYSEVLDFFQLTSNPADEQSQSQPKSSLAEPNLQLPDSFLGDGGVLPDLAAAVDPSKFSAMDFLMDGQSFDSSLNPPAA